MRNLYTDLKNKLKFCGVPKEFYSDELFSQISENVVDYNIFLFIHFKKEVLELLLKKNNRKKYKNKIWYKTLQNEYVNSCREVKIYCEEGTVEYKTITENINKVLKKDKYGYSVYQF